MSEDDDKAGKFLEGAVTIHEMFLSYIQAGFKRSEALELIKAHIANLDPRAGESHDDR